MAKLMVYSHQPEVLQGTGSLELQDRDKWDSWEQQTQTHQHQLIQLVPIPQNRNDEQMLFLTLTRTLRMIPFAAYLHLRMTVPTSPSLEVYSEMLHQVRRTSSSWENGPSTRDFQHKDDVTS